MRVPHTKNEGERILLFFFPLYIIDVARVSFIMITHSRNVVSILQLRLLTMFCSVGMSQLFYLPSTFSCDIFLCGFQTKLLHSKMDYVLV